MKEKLFEILPCGDPFSKNGWEIREYEKSFNDRFCIYRGDLSPYHGKEATKRMLQRMYPGCKIKVSN